MERIERYRRFQVAEKDLKAEPGTAEGREEWWRLFWFIMHDIPPADWDLIHVD